MLVVFDSCNESINQSANQLQQEVTVDGVRGWYAMAGRTVRRAFRLEDAESRSAAENVAYLRKSRSSRW